MPRTLPPGFAEEIASPAPTLALCVKVRRRDTVALCFTSWSETHFVGGEPYDPVDGIHPTALEETAGLEASNLDWSGILSDSRIREVDLRAGRYDGAKVTIMIAAPLRSDTDYIVLKKGFFGKIAIRDGQYQCEFNSLIDRLQQTIGEVTSASDRVKRLEDAIEDMSPHRFTAAVTFVSTDQKTLAFTGLSEATGEFNYGILKALDGDNLDVEQEIKSSVLDSGTTRIVLHEPFPYSVAPGDSMRLERGYDRTWARAKALGIEDRYHGEPWLPGNDYVVHLVARPQR